MGTLVKLLKQPGKLVPMKELLRDEGVNNDLAISLKMSKQDKVDHEAIADYKQRRKDNDLELELAMRNNDEASKERLYREKEALDKEIRTTKGLGGKLRELDSTIGRWRSAVNSRLKTVCKHLEAAAIPELKELADHFRSCTRSEGDSYVYYPSDASIIWRTER